MTNTTDAIDRLQPTDAATADGGIGNSPTVRLVVFLLAVLGLGFGR